MAYEEIVLQLVLISFILILVSKLMNKLLGMSPENMKEIRDKATNLQKRIANVKAMGDYRMMQELQMETMQLMKSMVKKQLVPMCLRCIVFLGIWTVLGFFYADYGAGSDFFFGLGWFFLYFLLAIGWSLLFYGIRRGIKKAKGEDDDKRTFAREIMGMLSPQMGGGDQAGLLQQSAFPSTPQTLPAGQPSWKDRIHDNVVKKDNWKNKIIPTDTESSQEVIKSESNNFCPTCGKKVDTKDNFCEHCRANLNE